MKFSRSSILSALWAGLFCAPVLAATVNLTIDAGAPASPIPPQAYGTNQELSVPQIPLYRQGGNRMTGYNWENNSSNGGADYCQSSGSTICNHEDWYDLQWFGLPQNGNQSPATVITHFVNDNNSIGAESIITLQMAGYVSTDGNCNCFVTITGAADSGGTHWKNVLFEKGAPFSDPPDTSDNEVYMDELMNYLLVHLGNSSAGGAKYYCLDNEAALWRSTHPLIHPSAATYAEVAGKGISLATIITSMDPGARILGPVAYGWSEFTNNQGAPDAGSHPYSPDFGIGYLCYYLDQMRQASNTAGRRLLHYLDVHWYPEAQGAGVRITNNDTSEPVAIARMQAPRSLWDPIYYETSWISGGSRAITLIPRLQAAVSQYYPGTKISITEYNYGTGQDISGGIAQADFLGIVGKYGVMACRWDDGSSNLYTRAAYNLYLNYDGTGEKFGELSMPASTSSVESCPVYAARSNSLPDKIWVIAINRDYADNNDASVSIANLSGGQEISSVRSFRFDTVRTAPTSVASPSFTAAGFTDSLPFRSATLYEITLSQPFITFTPTETGTSTPTPTITPTDTPTATGTLPTYTPTKTPTPSRTFTSTFTVTQTPTATPPGCPVMFNGCESLIENGTWNGANAARMLSATNVTQGNSSLLVNISGPPSNAYTNFNLYNGIMDLSGFSPAIWTGVGNLVMDVYVSPSLTAGTTISRFYLAADSDTAGLTNQYITSSTPVTAGANSVTFRVDFAPSFLNSLVATDHLTVLHFVYNTSATVTGSFYVDNIRLDRSPCAWTITPTVCTDGLGHTCTPTFTATITDTPTYTPTPSSINILFPNPVKDDTPPGFYYEVEGPVDQVKVKVFTVAFRKVYEDGELSADIGQHFYTFDRDKMNSISNGFYYAVLYRRTGGRETREIMKLLIRR